MNEEIITITTESVKVSDLQGREKQIYEYAYKSGVNEATNENSVRISHTISKIGIVIIILNCFYLIVFKGC